MLLVTTHQVIYLTVAVENGQLSYLQTKHLVLQVT